VVDSTGVCSNRFFGVGRMAGDSSPVAVVGMGVGLLASSGSERPVVHVGHVEKYGTNTPLIMLSLLYRSHDTIMTSMYAMSLGVNALCKT